MLLKANTLTKDKEFENVFKLGKSSFDKIIGIKAIENKNKIIRFGILVSTKISKKAVERNKIKRQIKDIIRLELEKLKQDRDVVVITLPSILGKTYQEIQESIIKHFKKLGLYK